MALEILKHRERVTITEYRLFYEDPNRPGSGYSFACNEHGVLIHEADNPVGMGNYQRIKDDPAYIFRGVVPNSWKYVQPGEGKCKCGRIVYLERDYGHGIDCDCGRIYNMSGQELAPRSQWDDRYDDDDLYGYNVRFGY